MKEMNSVSSKKIKQNKKAPNQKLFQVFLPDQYNRKNLSFRQLHYVF